MSPAAGITTKAGLIAHVDLVRRALDDAVALTPADAWNERVDGSSTRTVLLAHIEWWERRGSYEIGVLMSGAAIVEILQDIGASLHFVDILQSISRKLGEAFGLDRCSIFLAGGRSEVRLVASYEDPTIRNLVVDLDRYPELERAFTSGETVFVPDAMSDPMFSAVKDTLSMRNVRSVVVVPIRWRQDVIGAIFLRTERDATPFSDADVRFCQVVADLTAKALRNAHRFESLMKSTADQGERQRATELQRIALVAFLRRLLDAYATYDVGNGVSVTGGKFLSYLGYESFFSVNNPTISAANGAIGVIPGYHSGVKVDYSDKDWGFGGALLDSVYGATALKGDGELKKGQGYEGYVTYKGVTDLTLFAGAAFDNQSAVSGKDIASYNIWASYKVDAKTGDVLPALRSGNDHGWDAIRYGASGFCAISAKRDDSNEEKRLLRMFARYAPIVD